MRSKASKAFLPGLPVHVNRQFAADSLDDQI